MLASKQLAPHSTLAPLKHMPIGNIKGQNFAHFQNWNRDARLILYDRACLSEKLFFSKLFPKMPHLPLQTPSLLLVAIYINITNSVSLYKSSEAFSGIVY